MSLNAATMAKFFREIFVGQQPLVVDPQEREALGLQISERLRGLELVRVDADPYLREEHKAGWVSQFSVEDPAGDHWSHVTFKLSLDEHNRLQILWRKQAVLVSDCAEIVALALVCQQRMLRRKAQASKRAKVKNLKAQAVLARVKQLAREEKFDFYTDTNQRVMKLFIKLSERECAELQVPFKDFEAAVPLLRGAIQSLRGFHTFGLRFAVRQLSHYRQDWVLHESLA